MTRRLSCQTLLFATHNQGKLEEMRELLMPGGIKVVSAKDYNLPEPEETEDSFIGNARIKAHAAAQATGIIALSDDSGLCVDALNGAPGVYTADWAEGPDGRNFQRAMKKTHDALKSLNAVEPWSAQFRCVLVLAWPDGHDEVFEGSVEGRLVWPLRGVDGHGYDPMFVPGGEQRTFAEMPPSEKNSMSHRARALSALISACFT